MNHQQRIDRLETLLARVQTRAKQPRIAPIAATAQPEQDVEKDPLPGIAAPTPYLASKDETQPFERDAHGGIHTRPPAAEHAPADDVGNTAKKEVEEELEIDIEVDDGDDIASGSLEIISEPKQEQVAEKTLDADNFSEQPEAETKPLIALDLDSGAVAPKGASDAMIGATIELDEAPTKTSPVELDAKPVVAKARPSAEMEMVLPPSVAPGEFTPSISSQLPPSKSVGEPKSPMSAPTKVSVEAETKSSTETEPEIREQMPNIKLTAPKAPAPIAPAKAAKFAPVTLEVTGKTITSESLTAEKVAHFVGSLDAPAGETFMSWLDETLSLGI